MWRGRRRWPFRSPNQNDTTLSKMSLCYFSTVRKIIVLQSESVLQSEHTVPEGENRSAHGEQGCERTEPRFRRVLMLCFPLSPSSSSLTGLNINGGGSTGFSMGGSSPYFLKWMRQSVHSKMFSRPPWCQSLEAEEKAIYSCEMIHFYRLGGVQTHRNDIWTLVIVATIKKKKSPKINTFIA